jgi:hypothetical protein
LRLFVRYLGSQGVAERLCDLLAGQATWPGMVEDYVPPAGQAEFVNSPQRFSSSLQANRVIVATLIELNEGGSATVTRRKPSANTE